MVDRGGLENRCACKGTVGSNPTLSARKLEDRAVRCRARSGSVGRMAGPIPLGEGWFPAKAPLRGAYREANVSTEQPTPQENPWVPRADAHPERPEGAVASAAKGPGTARGLRSVWLVPILEIRGTLDRRVCAFRPSFGSALMKVGGRQGPGSCW